MQSRKSLTSCVKNSVNRIKRKTTFIHEIREVLNNSEKIEVLKLNYRHLSQWCKPFVILFDRLNNWIQLSYIVQIVQLNHLTQLYILFNRIIKANNAFCPGKPLRLVSFNDLNQVRYLLKF